jgi:hypothetical protein
MIDGFSDVPAVWGRFGVAVMTCARLDVGVSTPDMGWIRYRLQANVESTWNIEVYLQSAVT